MGKIITSSIEEYIDETQKRKYVPWKITSASKSFYHNNKWYDELYFEEFYPKYEYVKFNDKGSNPDKTRII